jgi:hypothetical protein
MNTYDSNILTTIKFFKNNIGKMLFFIITAMLITGIFSHKYYKDNQRYTSTITIRFNQAINWTVFGLVSSPHSDVLYFLENKGIENIRLRQGQNFNTYLEIEVAHESASKENNKIIKKIETILKDYEDKLITKMNDENDILIKKLESQILKNIDNEIVKSYLYTEIASALAKKEILLKNLKNNQLFVFKYDGVINIKKAKRLMVKNLLMSFMISIILIILSLWIKLFIREMSKNSK